MGADISKLKLKYQNNKNKTESIFFSGNFNNKCRFDAL